MAETELPGWQPTKRSAKPHARNGRVSWNIWLTPEEHAAFKAAAAANDWTLQDAARVAVRDFIQSHTVSSPGEKASESSR